MIANYKYMLEKLRINLNNLNVAIEECKEVQGLWNGKESGHLEDQAGLYGDVQNRLEEAKDNLLQAIVMLSNE